MKREKREGCVMASKVVSSLLKLLEDKNKREDRLDTLQRVVAAWGRNAVVRIVTHEGGHRGSSEGGGSKDDEARDAEARDAEARDAEARDAEARDDKARDAEARDAEARDAEARDAEARDGGSFLYCSRSWRICYTVCNK
ncbi:hypothetical protein CAPTEDRAFT_218451 [Capitella teleta]|uniref:Uncharacterized protein n=1 Tax=Capitella teleta TaxID=283909 RepID=R7VM11_CAPTE|nr:hypothetical protein CAPTEDRAFT_218451 [Capitella teleta]|eukprot:ELU18726.1 hypothetical protein CAPTEDRAFT_218451 [Capitella teleta]